MPESLRDLVRDLHASTVSVLAHAAQDAAHKKLISDLRMMVNDDGISDVIFTCKDGAQVKAIRSLLIGRCEVLKRMLVNGMKETNLSEINLPNVSSQSLLSVFEFLYTGTVVTYRPWIPRSQFEALLAAQFFLLPDLGDIVKGLLHETWEVTTDFPEAAAMLTVTLEFTPSFAEKEFDAIVTECVEYLSSNLTHSSYAASLSEAAIHCLLSYSKAADRREDEQTGEPSTSLTEYYRFRQIILWWVYQIKSGWSRGVEEVVESAVPIIRRTSCLHVDVGISGENRSSKSSIRLNSWLADHALRDSAKRLLSIIDLRCMHPLLIANVVEPLNCFSSPEITLAFRFHALNQYTKSITFENVTSGWRHGKFLEICDDLSAVVNHECKKGSAIALMRMSDTKRFHLWRFIVEEFESSKSFIEVGFLPSICYVLPDSGWHEGSLEMVSLSSLRGARVLNYTHGTTAINWQNDYPSDYMKWKVLNKNIRRGSCILFQLDLEDQICCLKLDGQDFGACWKNLPDCYFYPAVCIGSLGQEPYSGCVRLQAANLEDSEFGIGFA